MCSFSGSFEISIPTNKGVNQEKETPPGGWKSGAGQS